MLLVRILALTSLAAGLVTLDAMARIASLTKDCTDEILRIGDAHSVVDMKVVGMGLGKTGQLAFGNDQDPDDIEDTVAAALNTVNRKLLEVLNVALDNMEMQDSSLSCQTILHDFDEFLALTTRFLYSIQEKQQIYQWHGQSPAYHALSWLHDLWASRKPNEQSKSFIEQQMTCYSSTGCFPSIRDVLKRDVEIVEYMNDLLDNF